ncbi:hypothetical protein GCM10009772_19430 [Pseudonocardia alni subsp. carboxydivorans]|uniref:CBS domain-containing protein n=1 Tax=Pseudonocardia alni subsp. carboxydivorans TaxID=415010 RepID=A0ABU9ANW7_PSEA5
MHVRDVMRTGVTTVRADTPIAVAARVLVGRGHASSPVVDAEDRVVGVVSESDLLAGRVPVGGDPGEIDPEEVVAAVMTHHPFTAGPDDDLAFTVARMLENGLRALPVESGGRCVGLLSRHDVLREVARGSLQSEERWREHAGMASRDRG